jgi:non-specific serine/threonine protein kinase/serine/threonine-protein kinase
MTMRWETVRELVAQALELEHDAREALLERRTAGDEELLREVRELLELESRAERMFAAADRPRDATHEPLRAGMQVERWRLERKLGEGGMGVVWLAQRDDSDQHVALKLLHLPLLTASARRRFSVEQRALARLEHPNITRLIDGGVSANGVPYLATEWVDGPTLNAWCDERRLRIEARIELFIDVCAAAQAAHQRLVVHGDIKPSNVLVDREGRVKLCDFGIARLLDAEDASTTRSAVRALTPRYASPEQIRGEPVTTASDVYSLGALLYELLCGVAAHDASTKSTAELERLVCEQAPLRPSAAAAQASVESTAARSTRRDELARALRGDLDAIAMQCLAKDPQARYASAAALGDDLRRHLRHEPVRARPEAFTYVARRFVQRHRLPVALACLAAVALVAGTVVALDRARAAREAGRREALARAQAEERYAAVRKLATVLVFDAHDSIRNLPGSTAAREMLADAAAQQLDRLARDADGDRELERELARAYVRLGDALGRPVEANLGRTSEARARYQTALEFADRDEGDLSLRAWTRTQLADLLLHESRTDEASVLYEEALELRVRSSEDAPLEWSSNPTLGYLRGQLADVRARQGRLDDASAHAQAALEFAESALGAQPLEGAWTEGLAMSLQRMASLAMGRRELDAALSSLERASAAIEPLAAQAGGSARVRQRAAQIAGEHGLALARAGRREEARARHEHAVELHRSLLEADPQSAAFRDDLAVALRRLGALEAGAGEGERAVQLLEEALAFARANREVDPKSAKAARAFAVAADELGGVLAKLERDFEAIALHEQSLAIFAELAAQSRDDASAQRGHAVACSMLAQARATAAKRSSTPPETRAALLAQARAGFEQALEIVEQLAATGRLAPSDSGVPDYLRRQLAACDAPH